MWRGTVKLWTRNWSARIRSVFYKLKNNENSKVNNFEDNKLSGEHVIQIEKTEG